MPSLRCKRLSSIAAHITNSFPCFLLCVVKSTIKYPDLDSLVVETAVALQFDAPIAVVAVEQLTGLAQN